MKESQQTACDRDLGAAQVRGPSMRGGGVEGTAMLGCGWLAEELLLRTLAVYKRKVQKLGEEAELAFFL